MDPVANATLTEFDHYLINKKLAESLPPLFREASITMNDTGNNYTWDMKYFTGTIFSDHPVRVECGLSIFDRKEPCSKVIENLSKVSDQDLARSQYNIDRGNILDWKHFSQKKIDE